MTGSLGSVSGSLALRLFEGPPCGHLPHSMRAQSSPMASASKRGPSQHLTSPQM